MKVRIITDHCAELTPAELANLGIFDQLVPIQVLRDGEPFEFSAEEMYEQMSAGCIKASDMKTACPSPLEVLEVFEAAHEATPAGIPLCYLGISGNLSAGTANSVHLAAQEFREIHPERRILTPPTYCISNGLGLLLYLLQNHCDLEPVDDTPEEVCPVELGDLENAVDYLGTHLAHLFTIKDLSYAVSSGRFSNVVTGVVKAGQMISGLSPRMYFPMDGDLKIGRPLRYRKMADHWLSYYDHYADPNFPWVRIGFTGPESQELATYMAKEFAARGISQDHILTASIGPVVGTHVGPTCISLFFIQKEERNCVWHKEHY